MIKELYYSKYEDGSLECQLEILFIFDTKAEHSTEREGVEKQIFSISTTKDFYDVIQQNKDMFNNNCKFVLKTLSDELSDVLEQSIQLLSFYIFYYTSKKRLSKKMSKFNEVICAKGEKHVLENMQEFARMNDNGKYIRGTLSNLGYYVFRDHSIEYSDELALAFEVFQTAILVHDDIIDHANLRRNQPTIPIHYIENWYSMGLKKNESFVDVANSLAICSGDVGMYLANQKLVEAYSDSKNLAKLLKYFNQIVINTIKGEIIDVILPFEEQFFNDSCTKDITESIIEIYRLKTAWYTVIGPICLGAILAGASDNEIKKLEAFAEKLGIAFQIKDDILGIYGTEYVLGKNIGSDITEFKQTLLYSYVRKQDEYYNKLTKYYGNKKISEQDLKSIKEIFLDSGALKYAEQEMEKYFESAMEILNETSLIPKNKKTELFGLIWYLKLREY